MPVGATVAVDPAALPGLIALASGIGLAQASTGTLFPTGRASLPGYFAVGVGLLYLAAGGGLAWLGYSAETTGIGVLAVYFMWVVAAGLALAGGFLALVGLVAFRRRWIRGPAILAGGALGVAGSVALLIFRGSQGPLGVELGLAALALPFAGLIVGWRGGVFVLASLRPGPGKRDEG